MEFLCDDEILPYAECDDSYSKLCMQYNFIAYEIPSHKRVHMPSGKVWIPSLFELLELCYYQSLILTLIHNILSVWRKYRNSLFLQHFVSVKTFWNKEWYLKER